MSERRAFPLSRRRISNRRSPGRHGVSNVLAAIAVARAMGIAPERLRRCGARNSPSERCAASASNATA